MLSYTHTRLLVENFPVCYKFYKDTLGFECLFGDPQDVYAEFKTTGSTLALFKKELMSDVVETLILPSSTPVQDSVALTFAVENVDESYQELESRGVRFVTEPHDQPHWFLRVAHFRDPNGTLIEINSPLKEIE